MLGGMWWLGLGLRASRAQSTWIFPGVEGRARQGTGPGVQGKVLQGHLLGGPLKKDAKLDGSKVGVCPCKTRSWDQPL